MKKNDVIRCTSKEDVRQMMQDLNRAGFHAVAGGSDGLVITITGVPEPQYQVRAKRGRSRRKVYCETRKEADYFFEKYAQEFEFVEMLEGYPGEWKIIATSTNKEVKG